MPTRRAVEFFLDVNLTDILKGALGVYRRHPGTLFLVAAPAIPLGLATRLVTSSVSDIWLLSMVISPIILIPNYLLTAALVRAVADALEGSSPDFRRSYAGVFSRLGSIVLAALGFGVILHVLFIIFPLAIYLMVRWTFFVQAIVLEDTRPRDSFKRSGDIVSGSWWRVAGIVLVITIISAAPGLFLGFVVFPSPLGVFGPGLLPTPSAVSAVAVGAIAALMSPFAVGAETLLFLDLRSRRVVAVAAPA